MTDLPLILSLETATLAGSIAVSRGADVMTTHTGDPKMSHSNTLLADIDAVLASSSLSISDIDLFAVATGPGSFTGLRIGLATVKALATTLGRPCIGIPTLEAVAHSAGVSTATVTLLPAGRGEVFVQMFSVSALGTVIPLDEAKHLTPAKALERYASIEDIRWAGEAAQIHSHLIEQSAAQTGHVFVMMNDIGQSSPNAWVIVDPPLNLAQHIALLAALRAGENGEHTANTLRAIYVRPSDAELKV